jgi:hypothetical protein
MYSHAGTEYSYRLWTLDLIITYLLSRTIGKELKKGKKKNAHVLHNNAKVLTFLENRISVLKYTARILKNSVF